MNKERKLIIAGNWKMNKTVAEALALVEDLKRDLGSVNSTPNEPSFRSRAIMPAPNTTP